MSNILAIETTLGGCSVAVSGKASRHLSERNQQTSQLARLVEEVMSESGLEFAELDGYAVTTGPGSFTGVRIGIAFIRGLTLAVRKPIHAINTLELLAYQAGEQQIGGEMLCAINAYRGQVYLQSFTLEQGLPKPLNEPYVAEVNAIPHTSDTAIGDCPQLFEGQNFIHQLPQAKALAEYAEKLPIAPIDAKPSPLYLRPPDAKAQKGDLTVAQ